MAQKLFWRWIPAPCKSCTQRLLTFSYFAFLLDHFSEHFETNLSFKTRGSAKDTKSQLIDRGRVLPSILFYFTTLLSHWDFSKGKFGLLSPGKPAATESRYPTYVAYWVFKCFCDQPNSDTDYGIFNVHTDINACDSTRGWFGHT